MSEDSDSVPIARKCRRCGEEYKVYLIRDVLTGRLTEYFGPGSGFCSRCSRIRKNNEESRLEHIEESLRAEYNKTEKCWACKGRGRIVNEECPTCNGTGQTKRDFEFMAWDELQKNPEKHPLPEDHDKESTCFITTSCVLSQGLPDDCEQLTILRRFRDNYIAKKSGGLQDIADYYKLAPRIVRAINQSQIPEKIYEKIYFTGIRNALSLTLRGDHMQAYQHYKQMVLDLQNLLTR